MNDYGDSLRQQAAWIEEALDPKTPDEQRIELQDVDTDELRNAAAYIDHLENEIRSQRAEIFNDILLMLDRREPHTHAWKGIKDNVVEIQLDWSR